MGDLWTALIGLIGVLVGAAGGFFAVRWQHKANSLQQVREKCAELIFLGDQSANAREAEPEAWGETLRAQYKARVSEMESILRYLELAATEPIFKDAKTFMASTDKMGLTYQGGANPRQSMEEYQHARDSLIKGLRP